MPKFNPFRPASIVSPGMFSGRMDEVDALIKALWQTKKSNPEHFLITGERGIGKSSLFLFLQYLAANDIDMAQDYNFSFIVVNVTLEEGFTQSDIVKAIANELNRQIKEAFKLQDIATEAWNFLKKWEVMGVSFDSSESGGVKTNFLLEELIVLFENSNRKLRDSGRDGILVLVDEADKPSNKSNLGLTLKLVTEGLAKRKCDNVAFGLAGLPGLLTTLRDSHESSPRIFKPLRLDVLSQDDRKEVIRKGMAIANRDNDVQTTIQPDAEELIADLSEGYPHFLQQFAYSAFNADTDYSISTDDVKVGAFGKQGAIEELGHKYFEDLYFDQISSEDYRRVLNAMAQDEDGWVPKSLIKERSQVKETVLKNAISVLRYRHIIISRPGYKGQYKLPTKSFAVWIKTCTRLADQKTEQIFSL